MADALYIPGTICENQTMNNKKDSKSILIIMTVIVCALITGCQSDKGYDVEDTNTTVTPVIIMEDTTDNMDATESQDTGVITEPSEAEEESGIEEEESIDSAKSFYAEEISDQIFARMEGKSYPEDCMVPVEDLRYLHLLYKDIDGNTHEGEMVCNVAIADKLTDIFRQLYEADYPIERMQLIDDYDGDDDASMSDNNTSCFNYRVVSGTTKISKHGYGLAVDLNPRYNPYIHTIDGNTLIEPANGEAYADRTGDFDYKIDENDLAYRLFTQAGFTWGGSWKSVKDYQHFQMNRVKKLSVE